MPKLRSLRGAWREMRDTWKRQQSDPDYAYDTPLPEPADRKAGEDDLYRSIGELAPEAIAER